MPSTTIKVKVKGLVLDDQDQPVLELVPQAESGEALVMRGTAEDTKAFTKLFGRVVSARLSIGETEEQQSPAFNAGQVAGLEQKLKASEEALAAALKAAPAQAELPAVELQAALQKIRELELLARGYLRVTVEAAEAHAGSAKGSMSGHLFDIARQAKAGLAKLDVLCPPAKSTTNGAPAVPAAEA